MPQTIFKIQLQGTIKDRSGRSNWTTEGGDSIWATKKLNYLVPLPVGAEVDDGFYPLPHKVKEVSFVLNEECYYVILEPASGGFDALVDAYKKMDGNCRHNRFEASAPVRLRPHRAFLCASIASHSHSFSSERTFPVASPLSSFPE
ncbi:MAG: hypothetical protein ABSH08_09825 [Tepidisphaeraceae bacterium]|jgi:hypothetical protein